MSDRQSPSNAYCMDLFVSNNRVHHLVSIAYNTIVIRSIPKEKTQNRTDIWKLPIYGDIGYGANITRKDYSLDQMLLSCG